MITFLRECDHVCLHLRRQGKSRGLNSNMFLCRGKCFARLRKNSLPLSVVFFNWNLVSGEFLKLLFSVVKREFNSRPYDILHGLL